MDESKTRELLTRVLAAAPPPAPVDLDRLIERAEAQHRQHLRWVIAVAAALVLVVTIAVSVLTGSSGDNSLRPTHLPPSPSMSVEQHAWPTSAPAAFDPGRSNLEVDGVPASMVERGTAFRPAVLVFYADNRHGSGLLQVFVGAKGQNYSDDASMQKGKVVAGPPIHGRASKWYEAGTLGHVLRWDWAPGAHASVALRGTPNPEAVAATVASSIHIDLSVRTRMPYTLKQPAGFRLTEFQSDVTTDQSMSPAATVAYAGPSKSFISVNTNLLGNGIGTASTRIQGRPARVTSMFDSEGVNNTFITVQMAAGDLKVTGTCNYRPNSTITLADFKAECLATTASVQRVADLRIPASWPVFAPR